MHSCELFLAVQYDLVMGSETHGRKNFETMIEGFSKVWLRRMPPRPVVTLPSLDCVALSYFADASMLMFSTSSCRIICAHHTNTYSKALVY